MRRTGRIHYPGTVNHVMVRGNGRRDIFFGEPDGLRLYDLLENGAKRSTACANVRKRIPIWRQNVRG